MAGLQPGSKIGRNVTGKQPQAYTGRKHHLLSTSHAYKSNMKEDKQGDMKIEGQNNFAHILKYFHLNQEANFFFFFEGGVEGGDLNRRLIFKNCVVIVALRIFFCPVYEGYFLIIENLLTLSVCEFKNSCFVCSIQLCC